MTSTQKPLAIFGTHEENTIQQIKNCLEDDRAVRGAVCADGHLGYSMPIGGVVAYDGAVSPTGVGFDIGCGNAAVKTNLNIFHFDVNESASSDGQIMPNFHTIKNLMREIQRTISFGLGRSNATPVDHDLFDHDAWTFIDTVAPNLKAKARDQLGTVGSGNHYVDLLVDESGHIWVANHFGSRGLGHTICSGFMAMHAGHGFLDRVKEEEGAVVFDVDSEIGAHYIACMQLAGEYAYAGRDYVIDQVLAVIGGEAVEEVHNHHNFAWEENGLWVVRKGATPLTSKPAFIGGSMGDISVIVRGVVGMTRTSDAPFSLVKDIGAINSAPHGAGRVMSRTKAAGKMRKMWYCNNQNCTQQPFASTGPDTEYPRNCCPECNLPLRKGKMRDKTTAAVDWDAVRADLKARGIVVLGAGADESPGVYKDLATVLAAHENIEVIHSLRPLGVVMAGSDVNDPYKD